MCVDDIGKVVNPLIVEGQVHGGLAQGIAQALFEEAVHDESGTLTTGTLADYLVPSAADLPSFTTDRTETPSTSNVLGVKGVGEAGTIASTPAVVNAIVDAVRHLGVNDIQMPCTPMRVWQAIQTGQTDAGGLGGEAGGGLGSIDTFGRCPVIPAAFDYVAPTTVDDAVRALSEAGEDAKVIAGGQSLLPVLRMRLAAPSKLIDLGRIAALRGVREDGDILVIGCDDHALRRAARPAGP